MNINAEIGRWQMLVIGLLSSLFIIIPVLLFFPAAQIRRLHDVGKNALLVSTSYLSLIVSLFLFFFQAIPGVYDDLLSTDSLENDSYIWPFLAFFLIWTVLQFIVLLLAIKDGEKGINKYGESPKYVED